MSLILPRAAGLIDYPESDGKPMSDNTKQFRWIQVLHGNISALYHDRDDVFLAGDLLCYPEEGHPEVNTAPDVMVAFGRPKGDRRSYKYWEENDAHINVAFEILSPKNTVPEMAGKFAFYEDYGVEEYYIYDPDNNHLQVFLRRGEVLVRFRKADGFVSPQLGIRFDLSGSEMVVYYPDGRRFLTFEELEAERLMAEQRAKDAEQRAETAEQRTATAEQRTATAEQRTATAEQRAETAEQRAQNLQRRAERQADLMRRALRQQATPEELQELQQLLEPPPTSRG